MKRDHIKRFSGWMMAIAIIGFLFLGCPTDSDSNSPQNDPNYKVSVGSITGGTITVNPDKGLPGTEIKVWVNPNAGYIYKPNTLKGNPVIALSGTQSPYAFNLGNSDVTITAEFVAVPANNYTVTIGSLSHGTISASPQYGTAGTEITLAINPESGYGLKDGSLTYTPKDGTAQSITGNKFALPAAHVTINAVFEKKDAKDLLKVGKDALLRENFDSAIDAFEASYQGNKSDPEAIVYSSLGKLASIAKDEKVRKLMKERLGLTKYPGTIDGLISPDWLDSFTEEHLDKYYSDGEKWGYWYDVKDNAWFFSSYNITTGSGYYSYTYNSTTGKSTYTLISATPRYTTSTSQFPGLDVPAWFKDTGAYKDSLTSGNLQSAATWQFLAFANLIDKNPSGLNDLLDGILSSVFGASFDEVVARAAALKYDQSVELSADIIEKLGLTETLEGDKLYVGKAELEVLLSAMRIVKASLEWLTAYDWNTDLTFMKFDWNKMNDMDYLKTLKPANLPFNNNFLKDRNNGMMAKSKTDFIKAIDDTVAAYNYLIGEAGKVPQGFKNTLKEYQWVQDGFTQLKGTINSGGTFYIKESSGTAYANTAANALVGINMGKLFSPGQLSIDKLITNTEKAPVFYGSKGNGNPVKISKKADIKTYDMIGFEFNLKPVKEIVVKSSDLPAEDTYFMPLLSPEYAEIIFDLYNK